MMTKIKQYANDLLISYKELNVTWNNDDTEVTFHKINTDGFDVIVCVDEIAIYIFTDCDFHDHWCLTDFKNHNEAFDTIFGIVRDMLSENMQIKVLQSNGSPYRWVLQYNEENEWIDESTTGLLIWNYFGKRSAKVYKNQHIVPR